MATNVIQIRIDEELKMQATAICEALGMDLPTAIRMFLKRMVIENGLPFSTTLPNDDPQIEMTEDEKIDFVAARIMKQHKAAFEELAK